LAALTYADPDPPQNVIGSVCNPEPHPDRI
jgi:hypothetical protein